MRACREFRAALPALLERELPLERQLELEAHAQGCAPCGARLEEERALEEALLALPAPPLERLDVERNVRLVLQRIDQPPARPAPRRSAPWRTLLLSAAALLAALLAWRLRTPDAPPAPAADGASAERVRHERARDEVLHALAECAPGFDPSRDEAAAFARAVEERTAELWRKGWPVAALVHSASLAEDERLAARALRWLGSRPETSPTALRGALTQPELAAAAVHALADLGAPGLAELEAVIEVPRLRELVLARLERTPQPGAAAWLEEALRLPGRAAGDEPERARLAAALERCGAEGVPAWLRLSARGLLDEAELGQRLARIPGADEALGRIAGEGRGAGFDARLVLLGIASAGTRAGWDWVERMARAGEHEEAALLALARGTPEALAALLRLRAASGVGSERLQATLELVLARQPAAVAALARTGARIEVRELCELVGSRPGPELVPALIACAGNTQLPEPERRWSLLLVAEQGRAEDLPALLELWSGLRERTLQAAVLLALRSLGGPEALEQALADRPAAARRRVLAVFRDPALLGRSATTLARLGRAIESCLDDIQP